MRMFSVALSLVCILSACGSDDDGGGASGTGGSGGSGGGATTCADGYPNIGTACAVENEVCKACLAGWACCDEIRCEGGKWAMKQSHTACPADAGSDAASD